MKCLKCNASLDDDAEVCPECGTKVLRCPSCGSLIRKKEAVCLECGEEIPDEIFAQLDEIIAEPVHVTHKKRKLKKAALLAAAVVLAGAAAGGYALLSREKDPLKTASAGDVVTFGTYEQDNDETNGQEPVEWIVLDRDDDDLLLMSRMALDSQPYHTVTEEVTWEECSLREWLNSNFLNKAFTEEEQARIDSTGDMVTLLSYEDAVYYLSENDDIRLCRPTEYTKSLGEAVYVNEENGCCEWWIWTQGERGFLADYVDDEGDYNTYGYPVSVDGLGVRPVIRITLESN